jgi:hypothetical protein
VMNNIYSNGQYGIYNNTSTTITGEYNWWGDPSGPYHPTLNPGGLGNAVSGYVDFDPWLYDSVYWQLGITENKTTAPLICNLQVTPNPFSKLTTVNFSIERSAESDLGGMELKIYDVSGRLVRNFCSAMPHAPCAMQISWDGTDQSNRKLGSGVYFVTLCSGEYSETKKVLLAR